MKHYTKKTIKFYDETLDCYIKNGGAVVIKDKINKFIGLLSGKTVIDVACGPGHDTDYFTRKGIRCIGIDLSRQMINYAEKNLKGEFKIMDFFDLKFKDNFFDGMWCSSILVHIKKDDLMKLLKNSQAKLKKNGTLGIITVQKQKIKSVKNDTRQYTMYSKKELENYLFKSGFEILHSESFNYGNKKRLFILSKNNFPPR